MEKFLANNNLYDPENIDALLDFASIVRQLIDDKQYSQLVQMINYTIAHSYFEALSWCMGILQEEYEKDDCRLENFECPIGRSIPGFNEFVQRLQVESDASKNDVEKVCDKNGEVQSFFNILTYKTGYSNIHLIASENFDTKDNDYIQYTLLFIKN